MAEHSHYDYGSWTQEELRKAEATAGRFLATHHKEIDANFRAKMRFLSILLDRLNSSDTSLEQRLQCFAQIAEISGILKEEAEGFFELGSHPMVARILSNTSSTPPA